MKLFIDQDGNPTENFRKVFQVIISIYFGNLLDLFLITGHGVKFLVIHYRVQIIQEEFISSIHVNLASFYNMKIISQDYLIIDFVTMSQLQSGFDGVT